MSQQQRSHIPKFGSWDGDNVPYTAYFDNARKDKGTGVMINPNDPEENPDPFTQFGVIENDDVSNVFAQKNMKNGAKKSISNFAPPSPSPGPHRPRYGYNPADDIVSQRSASVPMFGAWGDEKDPKSAEGFTVIFQKVKEEKQVAASKFPPIPQQTTYNPNIPRNNTTIVKKWCCWF